MNFFTFFVEIVRVIPRYEKERCLQEPLQQYQGYKFIIFTERMTDQLARTLKYQRMYVDAIHGDKNQHNRDRVLANFKENRVSCF